jgi:hypothetical protein
MRLTRGWGVLCAGLWLCGGGLYAAEWPDYHEVLEVMQAQVPNLDSNEVNQALVLGLQEHLSQRMTLVTNPLKQAATPISSSLSQTNIFENAYGYLRVTRVDKNLADAMAAAVQRLNPSSELKGMVLDLRFAHGDDYRAASQVASLFLDTEIPLFRLDQETMKSSTHTNSWKLPLTVLVNQETAEAAEVLAGVLRQCNVGLLLGSNTAGRPSVYRDFPLKNGQVLRLATTKVVLDSDKEIPASGLVPDITVPVSLEDEKAYFTDAYRQITKPGATFASRLNETNSALTLAGTNRSSRRMNEAELVRRQKEGADLDQDERDNRAGDKDLESNRPVITDPALVRALDLLKGLALVQKNRPPVFNR